MQGHLLLFLQTKKRIYSNEWFTNDAAAAEEFVSRLEFEKVELEPVTEAPKTTPEAEKVTP